MLQKVTNFLVCFADLAQRQERADKRYGSGGAQWITSPSRAKARATVSGRKACEWQRRSDDLPSELKTKANAANDAAKQWVDKGIDLWKKIVAEAPKAYAPRRALADLYKKAERWNAFIEVLKEAVEKTAWAAPEDKIPILEEMIEVYRDRLKLDVMVVTRSTRSSACSRTTSRRPTRSPRSTSR